ncbi:hypothetical protein DAI22_08g051400 [Oryza sativa Japonica Group]|nr:hypothetical protein DAI22_08g051400 [Oryza sativa Japonica Group]
MAVVAVELALPSSSSPHRPAAVVELGPADASPRTRGRGRRPLPPGAAGDTTPRARLGLFAPPLRRLPSHGRCRRRAYAAEHELALLPRCCGFSPPASRHPRAAPFSPAAGRARAPLLSSRRPAPEHARAAPAPRPLRPHECYYCKSPQWKGMVKQSVLHTVQK